MSILAEQLASWDQWLKPVDSRLLMWIVLQITLVGLATYAIVALAGRATPAARAWICLLGLGCMTALPLVSMLQFYEWSWGDWLDEPQRSIAAGGDTEQPLSQTMKGLTDANGQQLEWWQQTLLATGELFSSDQGVEQGTTEEPQRSTLGPAFTRWLPAVLATGIALGAMRLLLGLWMVRRLRNAVTPLDDPQLEVELDNCARQLGVGEGIPIAISNLIGTPAVVGWREPLLLLPTTWRSWSADERRAVLAHELAHIQRSDYMLTAVAQAAVALHFFHPLAHALVSRLRLNQELAADGLAASLVGGSQRYVEILAGLALRQPAVRTPGPAQAFLPPRRMFIRRLEMLHSQNFGGRAWSRGYSAIASLSVVVLTLIASGLRPVAIRAQETAKPQLAVAAKASGGDLRGLIPPEIVDVAIEFDVPALLASEPARQLIESTPDILAQVPFDIKTLEQAMLLLSMANGEPQTTPLFLLRFSEGTELPVPQPDNDSSTTMKRPGEAFAANVRKIDSRTIVLGGSQSMRATIGKLPSDNQFRSLLERHEATTVRIAGTMNVVRQLVQNDNGMAAFAPLWEKVNLFSFGIDVSDSLTLDGRLDTTEPKEVADTLALLKTMAVNVVSQSMKNNAGQDPMERMLMTAAMGQAKKFLESTTIGTNESGVKLTAKVDSGAYAATAVLLPAVQAARAAALRTQSANNLKQLMLALYNYESAHGHFPPVVVRDPKTGAERSWRVEILPYLEGGAELYNEYQQNEAWDSPANQEVLKKMPTVFAWPGQNESTETPYLAIATDDGGLTPTNEGQPPAPKNVTDGTSNIVFLVETKPMVPWTKPADLTDSAKQRELAIHQGGFNAAFGDGAVRFISNTIDEALWQALTTRSSGDAVQVIAK